MQLTGVIIAFNEEAFIERSIVHAMQFCDRIIVVEGAVLKSRNYTFDGKSTDKTIDILVRLKAMYRDRLHVIFKDGFWESKTEMFEATNELMEDGWVVEIDCDEFLEREKVNLLMGELANRPDITQVNFWLYHFFGGFDRMVTPKAGAWGNQPTHGIPRFFRSKPGAKWVSHTPPRLDCGIPQKIMSRDEVRDKYDLYVHHYGYVWRSQAAAKSAFHTPWQRWPIMAEWMIVNMAEDPSDLGNFKSQNSYRKFEGKHPIDVKSLKEVQHETVERDPYLVFVGTGRCGTGYAAACMKANGVDVGHEKPGADGVSSWDLAFPKMINQPWTGNLQVPPESTYIHIVRNPYDCIASLMTISNKSWEYMCKASHNSMQYPPLLRSMMHYILWNTQCASVSKHTVRVERFEEDMSEKANIQLAPLKERVNQRDHPGVTLQDLHKVSPELTKIITQMAKAYGYE